MSIAAMPPAWSSTRNDMAKLPPQRRPKKQPEAEEVPEFTEVEIRPSLLFRADELFPGITFRNKCKKHHDLTDQEAERIFYECIRLEYIAHKKTVGAGQVPAYTIGPMYGTLIGRKPKDKSKAEK